MNDIVKDSETLIGGWIADPTIAKFTVLILGLLVIRFLAGVLQSTVTRNIENPQRVHTVRHLVSGVSYLIAFLFLTTMFKDRLGELTVAFGVASAGIAFALQEVIASVAGWVALSLGNFYSTGDRVKLGGIKGDVIGIGVLRTTLMECGDWVRGDLYNGRIVRVANSFVFKEPVFNYSSDFPFLWDEFTVPIKHGSDWKLAERLLQESCREIVGDYTEKAKEQWKTMVRTYQIEDAMVEPMVTMIANDNWIEFTVRYVTDYKRRRATQTQLFQSILEKIDDNADKVGLASATFQLVETPPIMNFHMVDSKTR